MSIHQTETQSSDYAMVSRTWRTTINFVGTFCLLMIAAGNYNNVQALRKAEKVQSERNRAMDEMLLQRARNQQFSYNMACRYAKENNLLCLEDPQWWADPKNYPSISNDPSGTGLFPKEKP
jgi:hypothetical protein